MHYPRDMLYLGDAPEEGVGLEEEDAPERRGFWDGVDLRLGAVEVN